MADSLPKCRLCKVNDADQTGSHIVPHFLVKHIDNEEGKKGRDKELGAKITADDTVPYFGKSILPEKLEEFLGNEKLEELLDSQQGYQSDFIVDHILCSDCEKKLAALESYYSKIHANHENQDYTTSSDKVLATLFWYSILWRISVASTFIFKMNERDEKKIRRILNNYLEIDLSTTLQKPIDSDLDSIHYRLIRCPEYSDDNPVNFVASPLHNRPYSIMIGEVGTFFYLKKSHANSNNQMFFGFEEFIDDASLNSHSLGENVKVISNDELDEVNIHTYKLLRDQKFKNAGIWLREIQNRLHSIGKVLTNEMAKEIFEKWRNSKSPFGIRHSKNEFLQITMEVIKQRIH